MRNIRLTIEYDGTGYAGWQVQNRIKKQAKTVQGTIENALHEMLGSKASLIASGRTDSGVHAKAQIANFKTKSRLPAESFQKALNSKLPGDITVLKAEDVSIDFHSRFSAKSKRYRYTILNSRTPRALGRNYFYRCPYKLNLTLMKKEARDLTGRRQFKSFQATDKKKTGTSVRNIKKLSIAKDKDFIHFDIEANGFLHNMVRNIVGTLLEVGRGKLPAGSIKKILKKKDRTKAGPTAPAKGLCLMAVKYIFIVMFSISTFLATGVIAEETGDPRDLNNAGVEFISQGKYKEAAKEFRKVLELDPEFNIARYNLGLSLYNTGRTEEAIAEFKKLTEKSPYFVNAHYNLGTIYLRQKMYKEALERLQKVAELKPDHAEARFNLGFIYYKQGKLDEAIVEYEEGLSVEPDNLRGHLSLGYIYDKKKMYDKAIEEYMIASGIDPDAKQARVAMGYTQSIRDLERSIEEDPNDFLALVHLGHIYYAKKMYEDAIDAYKRALEINPTSEIAESSLEKAVIAAVE